MIRAIATAALALGFAGTALADRGHDRHDRNDRGHQQQHQGRDQGRDHGRDHRQDSGHNRGYDGHGGGHYAAPRHYAPAPRYAPHQSYRWRAPPPRGWHPGWRESYGNGYRYWNNDYYYVVPSAPSLSVSFVVPLR